MRVQIGNFFAGALGWAEVNWSSRVNIRRQIPNPIHLKVGGATQWAGRAEDEAVW
jgi:hypothetical protein